MFFLCFYFSQSPSRTWEGTAVFGAVPALRWIPNSGSRLPGKWRFLVGESSWKSINGPQQFHGSSCKPSIGGNIQWRNGRLPAPSLRIMEAMFLIYIHWEVFWYVSFVCEEHRADAPNNALGCPILFAARTSRKCGHWSLVLLSFWNTTLIKNQSK